MQGPVAWPDGKSFAFTVFDDTDDSTLTSGPDVYQFLQELGMRTTKSVWPLTSPKPSTGGSSCQDPDYLTWVLELQAAGFEIALHGAAGASTVRDDVLLGLERFREMFGQYPKIHVNHHMNRDSLYWGPSRLSGANRLLYRLLTRDRTRDLDGGSDPESPYFWGDAAKSRITYVRNFVYSDINTLKACPLMPYHDPSRPLVNFWFASSNGQDCATFCKTIGESNQERLEDEGGVCIMYTHFGVPDFRPGGVLDRRFIKLMERLASRNCWFATVTEVLDHLRAHRDDHVITPAERDRLERRWLYERITQGPS